MVQFSARTPAIPSETSCGLSARVVPTGFLVDRDCLGQAFQFPLPAINPLMLHTGVCVKHHQSSCYQNFDLTRCSKRHCLLIICTRVIYSLACRKIAHCPRCPLWHAFEFREVFVCVAFCFVLEFGVIVLSTYPSSFVQCLLMCPFCLCIH